MSDYEKIWAILTENAKQQAKNSKEIAELKALAKADEAKHKQEIAKIKELAKTNKIELDERLKADEISIQKLRDEFGGFANNAGIITEDRLYRAFAATIDKQGFIAINNINYDQVDSSFKGRVGKIQAQYDIILFNSKHILIIEVKRKAHSNHLKQLQKKVNNFQAIYSQFKNYSIHTGLASEVYYDELIQEAQQNNVLLFQEQAGLIKVLI